MIDKFDTVELVREKLAEILFDEQKSQQEKATEADKDPVDWALRVFLERSNPWEEFTDPPPQDSQRDFTPLVNISWDNSNDDEKASDPVERQRVHAVFNIDVYGAGVGRDTSEGHQPGDELAVLERDRALRLVRNIIMAGHYTYLGMRGVVTGRWRVSTESFEPPIGEAPKVRVRAARIALRVSFNEFSPQVEGVPLELIAVIGKSSETGEVLFTAQYPQESDS
ncbi:MAG TPA: hypothetical protein VJN18_32870 [Polyangiaceae bacterium]|nr:hypothetical protein [Polyangiaceae bacterium]